MLIIFGRFMYTTPKRTQGLSFPAYGLTCLALAPPVIIGVDFIELKQYVALVAKRRWRSIGAEEEGAHEHERLEARRLE